MVKRDQHVTHRIDPLRNFVSHVSQDQRRIPPKTQIERQRARGTTDFQNILEAFSRDQRSA